jgi:hypothetical protein
MLQWEDRPFEIAYGLNPAFLSILLYQAIAAFEKQEEEGMPYALSMLVIPMVFYAPIRTKLPKNHEKSLHDWIKNNPETLVQFPSRVNQLIPYSKESIIFAMQHCIIKINPVGNFVVVKKRLSINNLNWLSDSRTYQMCEKAKFLGKWFALQGSTDVIYRTLGIKP